MSNKLRLSVLGLGLVIAVMGVVAGCGETSTSVLYSTPNWLPDGRIICGKLVIKTSQQIYGGGISESRSYVAAFYPTGTGEVELFEGGGKEITCSPTGEMVAYIASYYDANGKYVDDGIQILDYSGNKVKLSNASKVK